MIVYLIICAICTIALLVIAFVERDTPRVDVAVQDHNPQPAADAEPQPAPAQKRELVTAESDG